MSNVPEVWLRGEPTPGLLPQLQPAANALLQAWEEIETMLANFPEELLWMKPAGVASVGFHLKHMVGVLNRLLTYAEGHQLSEKQMVYLKSETHNMGETLSALLLTLKKEISKTIELYKIFSENDLTAFRGVGRKGLPSTVIGLCFHAAEHTMRHTGQLLVTIRVLMAGITP